MKKLVLVFALPFAFWSSRALAATYTVTTTNNAGAGSLRQALLSSNADSGSTVAFGISGVITLSSALPTITARTTIDGTTAPGFAGVPNVSINFNTNTGLIIGENAKGSVVKSLSLVKAGNAGITLQSSEVTLAGNYIGLNPDGTINGNSGDGVSILSSSNDNLIGNVNTVEDIEYFDTSSAADFTVQPVSEWLGIRNSGTNASEYLISGRSETDGLLYVGPISGGGESFTVQYPGADTISTSVFGPDNLEGGLIRLVGSYRKSGSGPFNHGFVWEGTASQLPAGGTYRTIDYPGASRQFTHSAMGNLAVGNADGPIKIGKVKMQQDAGRAYVYDLSTDTFVANVIFPGSNSNTAYGIWQNGPATYTICGGYSAEVTSNLQDQGRPLIKGKAYLVDYNASTDTFSNWQSFDYPNGDSGVAFETQFEGISSTEPGVYTVVADSIQAGSTAGAQGSWISITRSSDNTFAAGEWVDLNFPDTSGSVTAARSVFGNQVVGVVAGPDSLAYQATLNIDFQLSNVISGNQGNGIRMLGSNRNIVSMNYIGTDPDGSVNPIFGNGINGILITQKSAKNLIGGQAAGINNPTGNKNPADAVFQRPPQGNLISGNVANGVLIDKGSSENTLSGNFIGTDATGLTAVGNQLDGVAIEKAPANTLAGCTLFENPFVFYNVISGNVRHGVSVKDSDDVLIQANFLGMGADNATSVPNGGNGLLVSGDSKKTQVGGVIPLGNVISGNSLNGIEVRDSVRGFVSFNTFAGIAAFQPFASPNGLNGILITATGGNNTVRTCIVSGNAGNGIVIGGSASGVEITETAVGTNTEISSAIPNQQNGIVIQDKAQNNAIGGFQPSVEPRVFVAGNTKVGILIRDKTKNNSIFHATIGRGAAQSGPIPNGQGGVVLDTGTKETKIGGKSLALQVGIQANIGAGLSIFSSTGNNVRQNLIEDNSQAGVFATGNCSGTSLKKNTIQNNGAGGTNNVNIAGASGITLQP